MAPRQKVQPLDWQTPIVDPKTGTPSSQFMRLWQTLFQNEDGTNTNAASAQTTADTAETDAQTAIAGLLLKADKIRQVIAGAGLTGGGDLSLDRTFNIGAGTGITVAADSISLTNTTVTPGTYGDSSHIVQIVVDAQGRITGATPVSITTGGIGAVPTTRTISAGTGLSGGGDLSADRTISLANTAVTAGTYGDATHVPQITVDAQGRITGVTSVLITGGGGGGATTPAVIRNSLIQRFASASSFNVLFPTGSLAGDKCWVIACDAWGLTTPSGWTLEQTENGSNVNFSMFSKTLTSGDISTGFVTVAAAGAFEAVCAAVTWTGNPAGGITSPVQYVRNTGGPATTSITASLVAQDTAVYFAYMRANGTVSINWGTTMGGSPVAGSNASGTMTSETVASATTRTVTATYGVSATGVVQIVAVMKGT